MNAITPDLGKQRPDPMEVLAFIESGMSMSGPARAERWPEWNKLCSAAYQRFERECAPRAPDWRFTPAASSMMVETPHDAQFHWVYLPLIRAALGKQVQS